MGSELCAWRPDLCALGASLIEALVAVGEKVSDYRAEILRVARQQHSVLDRILPAGVVGFVLLEVVERVLNVIDGFRKFGCEEIEILPSFLEFGEIAQCNIVNIQRGVVARVRRDLNPVQDFLSLVLECVQGEFQTQQNAEQFTGLIPCCDPFVKAYFRHRSSICDRRGAESDERSAKRLPLLKCSEPIRKANREHDACCYAQEHKKWDQVTILHFGKCSLRPIVMSRRDKRFSTGRALPGGANPWRLRGPEPHGLSPADFFPSGRLQTCVLRTFGESVF